MYIHSCCLEGSGKLQKAERIQLVVSSILPQLRDFSFQHPGPLCEVFGLRYGASGSDPVPHGADGHY